MYETQQQIHNPWTYGKTHLLGITHTHNARSLSNRISCNRQPLHTYDIPWREQNLFQLQTQWAEKMAAELWISRDCTSLKSPGLHGTQLTDEIILHFIIGFLLFGQTEYSAFEKDLQSHVLPWLLLTLHAIIVNIIMFLTCFCVGEGLEDNGRCCHYFWFWNVMLALTDSHQCEESYRIARGPGHLIIWRMTIQ